VRSFGHHASSKVLQTTGGLAIGATQRLFNATLSMIDQSGSDGVELSEDHGPQALQVGLHDRFGVRGGYSKPGCVPCVERQVSQACIRTKCRLEIAYTGRRSHTCIVITRFVLLFLPEIAVQIMHRTVERNDRNPLEWRRTNPELRCLLQ
jgi:hypothetical protein